jgi:hypothetical protein
MDLEYHEALCSNFCSEPGIYVACVSYLRACWFICKRSVMLSLYVNLTGLRGVPLAGKTLLLGVCGRAFLKEVSTGFSRVSKTIHPQEVGWAPPSPLGAWRMNFLLFHELRSPAFLPANLRALDSHALGPRGLTAAAAWFSGLWPWAQT